MTSYTSYTSYTIDKYYIDTCSICLSDIYNNDIIFTSECNHWFHASCILPWFACNHSCPNCRQEITLTLRDNSFGNLTDIIVNNIFDNDEDLHEDLAYYLLLRDVLVVVNDIDCLNNICSINSYLYSQLNLSLIYREIFNYIYTTVMLLISYMRNIDLNYCILNNNNSLYANSNDIDPYYNLPYY